LKCKLKHRVKFTQVSVVFCKARIIKMKQKTEHHELLSARGMSAKIAANEV